MTIGFSVEERDRSRLDHLAEVFGGGNRSAFLRAAFDVMERLELAQQLGRTQAYGAERLAEGGYTTDDIPEIVERALASRDPAAVAQARLVVADITRSWPAPHRDDAAPEAGKLRQAFSEALTATATADG